VGGVEVAQEVHNYCRHGAVYLDNELVPSWFDCLRSVALITTSVFLDAGIVPPGNEMVL
jgi:hypothetical protein